MSYTYDQRTAPKEQRKTEPERDGQPQNEYRVFFFPSL